MDWTYDYVLFYQYFGEQVQAYRFLEDAITDQKDFGGVIFNKHGEVVEI
jgi:hypothetical protein